MVDPSPRSMPGTYGASMGQGVGVSNPLFYDMMEAIPPASTTIMWNMGRVQNTLLRNNSFRSGNRPRGFRQTFSPGRFFSLADVSNIDPSFFPADPPTRRAARKANRRNVRNYNRSISKRGTPSAAKRISGPGALAGHNPITYVDAKRRPGYTPFQVSGLLNSMYGRTEGGKVLAANNQRMFAPGAMGTMATAGTLMAGAANEKQLTNFVAATQRFGGSTNEIWANAARTGRASTLPGASATLHAGTVASVGHMNMRFGDAKFTGRATGYFSGAQAARQGNLASAQWSMARTGGADNFFGKGLHEGAEGWAQKRIGARIAGSALTSGALRAAGPIGWALLAKDIAGFGGKMVGRGIKLSIEAVESAQGDLSKAGPGLGYQDNSVAATSRQRGVMAISNSRLNARSALGGEAAMLHRTMG